MRSMPTIVPETPKDSHTIHEVVRAAFESDTEPSLVDGIRNSSAFIPELSLVARDTNDSTVIGHVMFSRLRVGNSDEGPLGLVLAPLAVAPSRQGEGVGSQLVYVGLDRATELGYRFVVLHGPPEYYHRFGFSPAERFGFENPFDTPSREFMAAELVASGLEGMSGNLKYPEAFKHL